MLKFLKILVFKKPNTKECKETMRIVSYQIEDIKKDIEITQMNQIDILELKITILEIQISLENFKRSLSSQKKNSKNRKIC